MQTILPPSFPHPGPFQPFQGRPGPFHAHPGPVPGPPAALLTYPPFFYPWHAPIAYAPAHSPAPDPWTVRSSYDHAAWAYPHPNMTLAPLPSHAPEDPMKSAKQSARAHANAADSNPADGHPAQHTAPFPSPPLPLRFRGPPLKAKQSGCAVWVGNLPDDATVIQLKDHFSAGASDEIESVFLIKKTSCAFVNYSNEASCRQAVQRFNRNLFRGTRLVCRMRFGASIRQESDPPSSPRPSEVSDISSSSAPSSPLTPTEIDDGAPLIVTSDISAEEATTRRSSTSEASATYPASLRSPAVHPKVSTRLFVLKSLTLQDLLVSTRDGTWMTQPHNEEKLNEAFRSAENVYLVFSVNKSGQYFGYARMESPIQSSSDRPEAFGQVQQYGDGTDPGGQMPYKFPTPATASAPAGIVINDSARGTIFWERLDTSGGSTVTAERDTDGAGKQFAIRWLSTIQVPFHATRGLRNPLNCNREVKIARDGTEVDAYTGSRLLQLFHRGDAPY